jgi:alginate O-acetyltransferase complex protein AlgI
MLFDTPVYFCFLTLVVLVYWWLGKRRQQNVLLLLVSYFFYGWWDWRFVGLMFASTLIDFCVAQAIAAADAQRRRRQLLVLSLIVNLGILATFKYFNFFVQSLVDAANAVGLHDVPLPLFRLILPLGISFYTFQEIAYVVDVYWRKQTPARSFVDYALFVSLFPHLISGPIQRPHHLLGQVQNPRRFQRNVFFDGLMLIALGLFRKCVIADNFATLANAAFRGQLGSGWGASVIGAVSFAFQIYGDFSGYTDLARGSAKLLGFEFMVNFRRPYLAATLRDFWRRWHISLSSWLRDYLYIPLGGNLGGRLKTMRNLMITMLLGGLWHGANWTFLVWGGIHGGGLALERALSDRGGWHVPPLAGRLLSRIATLCVVGVAWIFFRAQSLGEALRMLTGLVHPGWYTGLAPFLDVMLALGFVVVGLDLLLEKREEEYPFQQRPHCGLAIAVLMLLLTVTFGAPDSNAFIYFQF